MHYRAIFFLRSCEKRNCEISIVQCSCIIRRKQIALFLIMRRCEDSAIWLSSLMDLFFLFLYVSSIFELIFPYWNFSNIGRIDGWMDDFRLLYTAAMSRVGHVPLYIYATHGGLYKMDDNFKYIYSIYIFSSSQMFSQQCACWCPYPVWEHQDFVVRSR